MKMEGMVFMEEKFYTPIEISKRYKVTTQAVNKWIREGKLKAIKLGNVWRIPESALLEFIKSNQENEK